jgi:hypothetical protein
MVDLLPGTLWRPGNLVISPLGDLHFCVGGETQRTIEWNGRVIARGVRSDEKLCDSFDHEDPRAAILVTSQHVAAMIGVVFLCGLVARRRRRMRNGTGAS